MSKGSGGGVGTMMMTTYETTKTEAENARFARLLVKRRVMSSPRQR